MITLRQITLSRGVKVLLDGADLALFRGQKVGIIGANGCGKTSLFSLIAGRLHTDKGDVELVNGLTIAEVAQEIEASPQAAIDFTLDGDAELREIERALAAAEHDNDGERLAELHERYDHVGGYTANSRAAQLLHGLGFTDADLVRPVAKFSGGWRVRLALSRALMCRSDLLLLDEPTNHLDLDAVIWLERWLGNYRGTLLVISHDREFLDNVASHICHFDNGKLKLYTGGYSAFERMRAEALAVQAAAYARQQREVEHIHSFVQRFRAKATKAKQAQSRLKALERMELIAPAHVDSPFSFEFAAPVSRPDPVIQLDAVRAGYGDHVVLPAVTLNVRNGSRIGLLGRNGAGKSTLIKTLAGELAPLSGKRFEAKGARIGYFAQHQLESLRVDESPLWHLVKMEPRTKEQELRDYIGGFDFRGDMALSRVGPFSGGEKARLALALIIRARPNLMLLDEPTNHLDLEMRLALTQALQGYEGALVVVSHDRHLLRSTCDELWLVANGEVAPFAGDLEDYRSWLENDKSDRRARTAAQAANAIDGGEAAAATEEGLSRKELRHQQAEARQRVSNLRKPLASKLAKIEKEIEILTREKMELDKLLASTGVYEDANRERMQAAIAQQGDVNWKLADAEQRWLTVHEELDALDKRA
jgi:ATP-binding cassette subfamily F protein 3